MRTGRSRPASYSLQNSLQPHLTLIVSTAILYIDYLCTLFPCAFSVQKIYVRELSSLMQSFLRFRYRKSRLPFRTSGSLSTDHCNSSGYPVARAKAPGPRHPLDPVLLRHTQINHSARLADGIIVPWRSNRRYVFFILFVFICSIAFPFRTCGPFFLDPTIAYPIQLVRYSLSLYLQYKALNGIHECGRQICRKSKSSRRQSRRDA